MPDRYEGIGHVVHVSTGVGGSCEDCDERVGAERFAESVNHYIEAHGYRLLHVGTEWGAEAEDGGPVNYTVAVLGK